MIDTLPPLVVFSLNWSWLFKHTHIHKQTRTLFIYVYAFWYVLFSPNEPGTLQTGKHGRVTQFYYVFFFSLFVFTDCLFLRPFILLFVPECINANKQWMTRLLWQNVFIYISLYVFQVFIYTCSDHNSFGQVGVFVRVCVRRG